MGNVPVTWSAWGGLLMAATVQTHAAPPLPPGESRAIAQEAWIAAYPLFAQYPLIFEQAVNPHSKSFAGGFGHWSHAAPPTADANEIAADPDLATSSAWVDVRSEPWVLTLPPVNTGRYLTCRCTDLWGYVLDNPGTLLDGDAGGSYLLVPPQWNGTLPEGIRRAIKGESSVLRLVARVERMDRDDLASVKRIQHGLRLEPLSSFAHASAPPPAATLAWPSWVQGSERTIACFRYAGVLLELITPHAGDQRLRERMGRLGIGPGRTSSLERRPAAQRAEVAAGVRFAMRELSQHDLLTENLRNCYGSRRELESDYRCRAMAVAGGAAGNVASQLVGETWTRDARGEACDAAHGAYRLTFTPGGSPPAQFYWAVSVYALPSRRLVQNKLGRYSIGSHDRGLDPDSSGAITIDIQHEAPGAERVTHWLPAPSGAFIVVLRVIGPQSAILDGLWKPPVLSRRARERGAR